MRLFLPLQKIEPQPDGGLRVVGAAGAETPDESGERATAASLRVALVECMRRGVMSVREMGVAAIGAVESAGVDAAGVARVVAHIIDPTTVKKLAHRVLRGLVIDVTPLRTDPLDPARIRVPVGLDQPR